MAYLGIVPAQHSSGAKRRQGAITKADSPLTRRMLLERAWTYRLPTRVPAQMKTRLTGLPRADPVRMDPSGQVKMLSRTNALGRCASSRGKDRCATAPGTGAS